MSAQNIRTFDGNLRLLPAFWAAVSDLKVRKMGIKFDEFPTAGNGIFRLFKMRESKF
jgi:hypothetical protein